MTVTSLEMLKSNRSLALARKVANSYLNNVYQSYKESNG
jgi:hypothetical protein